MKFKCLLAIVTIRPGLARAVPAFVSCLRVQALDLTLKCPCTVIKNVGLARETLGLKQPVTDKVFQCRLSSARTEADETHDALFSDAACLYIIELWIV
jgi:hypothetical protein